MDGGRDYKAVRLERLRLRMSLMDEPRQEELEAELAGEESPEWDEPLLAHDLEAAYLRALEASEAVEREMDTQTTPAAVEDAASVVAVDVAPTEVTPVPVSSETAAGPSPEASAAVDSGPRISEKQVVEAALFVGGMPLTAKKLSSLFHTDHGFGFVECLIDELNRQYTEEGRPYSITLGEGGYRLSLLPEFEPVRNKVFGFGPKDVKLTQDALEVLALVAYQQPITKSQMEALGKSNTGSVLRQLLQRELIRIDRAHSPQTSKSKNDPPYVTTPRFLSLFGIGNLSDLPVAEDFAFK